MTNRGMLARPDEVLASGRAAKFEWIRSHDDVPSAASGLRLSLRNACATTLSDPRYRRAGQWRFTKRLHVDAARGGTSC